MRKNPINLVKAFIDIDSKNSILILKFRKPRGQFVNKIEADIYNEFIKISNLQQNIYLIDEELELLDLYKLYTYFDYYISPHCGEGFGFTIYDNMILGNKIISPYYSGETEYLKREEIVELEYEEKEINGLRQHPAYGQMKDFKGAYISVENISMALNKQNFVIDVNDYILYFVHLTCTQDFNTGIQKVTRELSVELNKKKKVLLIKYNESKNDYEVINDNELQIFMKYGGVDHYAATVGEYNFKKLSYIYNSIKYERNILIIPEIYYGHKYKLFRKFFQLGKERNYIITHVYHDDSIYYTSIIPAVKREMWFDEYMKTISIADNIYPNSYYSSNTYNYHRNRLNLNSKQNIKTIQLGTINSLDTINTCFDNIKLESNLIISNISKTPRKNCKNLLAAFKLLRQFSPNLKLIIFGNGWINKFDRENNIEYKSFVCKEEKDRLFKNSLFSIYPSLYEGYGLPIYESLVEYRCVICHNKTSTLEIANNINQPCVSAVDCKNTICLFREMKKFCNKRYLTEAQKSIKNVKFKTYQEYGNELYNCRYNLNDKVIFIYTELSQTVDILTGFPRVCINLIKNIQCLGFDIIPLTINYNTFELEPYDYSNMLNFKKKNIITNDKYFHIYYQWDKIKNSLYKKILLIPEVNYLYNNLQKKYGRDYDNSITKFVFDSAEKMQMRIGTIFYDNIPLINNKNFMNKDDCGNKNYHINYLQTIKRSEIIFPISNFSRNELLAFYNKEDNKKLPFIKNIFLPEAGYVERVLYDFDSTEKIILNIGTLCPRKNQITLIKAFNLYCNDNPNDSLKLVIVGQCFEESYKKSFIK